MDLVLLLDAPFKHRGLKACIASHRKHLPAVDSVITVGAGGILPASFSTPKDLLRTMHLIANSPNVSDQFILSRDTTHLTAAFDPSVPRCRKTSGYLLRKKAGHPIMQAMVGSIQYLLHNELPTYDYEVEVPRMYDKADLAAVLSSVHGGMFHTATLYFNSYYRNPERIDDTHIPQWLYNMKPEGPVVSLGETALEHPDCRRWILINAL